MCTTVATKFNYYSKVKETILEISKTLLLIKAFFMSCICSNIFKANYVLRPHPVWDECNFFWTNEYKNIFVTIDIGRMNIRIYLSGEIDHK